MRTWIWRLNRLMHLRVKTANVVVFHHRGADRKGSKGLRRVLPFVLRWVVSGTIRCDQLSIILCLKLDCHTYSGAGTCSPWWLAVLLAGSFVSHEVMRICSQLPKISYPHAIYTIPYDVENVRKVRRLYWQVADTRRRASEIRSLQGRLRWEKKTFANVVILRACAKTSVCR